MNEENKATSFEQDLEITLSNYLKWESYLVKITKEAYGTIKLIRISFEYMNKGKFLIG